MATVEDCDRYGFFNGVLGIEQSNWAQFWKGVIPDGVIAGIGNEMQVYAQSDGLKVHVKTGEAMIAGHRAWVNAEKVIEVAENASGSDRTDGIVLRVTYGNDGESKIQILSKTGSTALTQTIGSIYEILLASVTVADGAVTLAASTVTDERYIFKLTQDTVNGFTGTSVTPLNDQEYRNNTAIASLTVYLPDNPNDTYITTICFTSASSFSGVTFRKGSAAYSGVKLVGDALTFSGKRYNLVIWWDGVYYWCAAKAAA